MNAHIKTQPQLNNDIFIWFHHLVKDLPKKMRSFPLAEYVALTSLVILFVAILFSIVQGTFFTVLSQTFSNFENGLNNLNSPYW